MLSSILKQNYILTNYLPTYLTYLSTTYLLNTCILKQEFILKQYGLVVHPYNTYEMGVRLLHYSMVFLLYYNELT